MLESNWGYPYARADFPSYLLSRALAPKLPWVMCHVIDASPHLLWSPPRPSPSLNLQQDSGIVGMLTPLGASSSLPGSFALLLSASTDTTLSLALNSAHPSPRAPSLSPSPHPSLLIAPDSWYSPLSLRGCGAILVSRCLGKSGHGFFTHCFWDCPSGQWSAGCSWKLWDSCLAFKDLVCSAHNSSSYTQTVKVPNHQFNETNFGRARNVLLSTTGVQR